MNFTENVLFCFVVLCFSDHRRIVLETYSQNDELSKCRYIHLFSIKAVWGKYIAKSEGKEGNYPCTRNLARTEAIWTIGENEEIYAPGAEGLSHYWKTADLGSFITNVRETALGSLYKAGTGEREYYLRK